MPVVPGALSHPRVQGTIRTHLTRAMVLGFECIVITMPRAGLPPEILAHLVWAQPGQRGTGSSWMVLTSSQGGEAPSKVTLPRARGHQEPLQPPPCPSRRPVLPAGPLPTSSSVSREAFALTAVERGQGAERAGRRPGREGTAALGGAAWAAGGRNGGWRQAVPS